MSAFSSIRGAALAAAQKVADAHRRRQTMRTVESLPMHIQKDIGWVNGGWSPDNRRGG